MKKIYLIVLSLLILPLYSASSEKKARVGVAQFAHEGVSKQTAVTITDLFRNELVNLKTYDVLDRKNMEKSLKELEFQQTGMTESEQAVKMGKMLNVEYMVYGTVSRLEKKYIVSAKMVEIETSKIEKSANHSFYKLDDADSAVKTLIKMLITGKKYVREKKISDLKKPEDIKAALIKRHCTSKSKYKKYKILGDLYDYDGILEKYYYFLLYKEISMPSRDEILQVCSNLIISNVFSKKNLIKTAKKAHKEGKPYAVFGYRMTPNKGDNRTLEYRVYHDDGKPTALEIFLIARDKDWNAKAPKTLRYEFE